MPLSGLVIMLAFVATMIGIADLSATPAETHPPVEGIDTKARE